MIRGWPHTGKVPSIEAPLPFPYVAPVQSPQTETFTENNDGGVMSVTMDVTYLATTKLKQPAFVDYMVSLPDGDKPTRCKRIIVPSIVAANSAVWIVTGHFVGTDWLLFGPAATNAVLEWDGYAWHVVGGTVGPMAGETAPEGSILLTATASSSSIPLSWTALAGALGYNVKRSLSPVGAYAVIAYGVVGTAFTDENVSVGVTYYYVVTGVNAVGEGTTSNQVSAALAVGTGGDDGGGGLSGPGGVSNGIVSWLKADAGVYQDNAGTTQAVNGSYVNLWKDQSGQGHDMFYPENGSTGTLNVYETGAINSQPTIVNPNLPSYSFSFAQPQTFCLVARITQSSSQGTFLIAGGNGMVALIRNTVGYVGIGYVEDGSWDTIMAGIMPLNTYALLTFVLDGANSLVRINGVSTTGSMPSSASITGIQNATTVMIGNDGEGLDFLGDMPELCQYGRHLTDAEITTVEDYLKTKYGL